jgi:hypothetical protein
MTQKKSPDIDLSLLSGLAALASEAQAFLSKMNASDDEASAAATDDLDEPSITSAFSGDDPSESSPDAEEPEVPFEERLRRARVSQTLRPSIDFVEPDAFDRAYAHLAKASPSVVAAGEAAFAAYAAEKEKGSGAATPVASKQQPSPPTRRTGRVVPPARVPIASAPESAADPAPVVAPDPQAFRSRRATAAPTVPTTSWDSRQLSCLLAQVGAPEVQADFPCAPTARQDLLDSVRRAWGRHLAQAEPPSWGTSWIARWDGVCADLVRTHPDLTAWTAEARGAVASLSSWLGTAADNMAINNPWDLPSTRVGQGVIPPPPATISAELVAELQAAADLQAWTSVPPPEVRPTDALIRFCLSDRIPALRCTLSTQNPHGTAARWTEQALDRLAVVEARLVLSLNGSSPSPMPVGADASPRKPRP